MKSLLIAALLFSSLALAPAHADQCSVDLMRVTNITNLKPSRSLDSAGRQLISAVVETCLQNSCTPTGIRAAIASGIALTNNFLNEPLQSNTKDAVDELVDYFDTAVFEEPDDLVVRINGRRVVPFDYSASYEMAQGEQINRNLKASFRGGATLQLIDVDDFSLNDDLGSFTAGATGILYGQVPAAPEPYGTVINHVSIYYELEAPFAGPGTLSFSSDGSFVFQLGSDFGGLANGETVEVDIDYQYSTYITYTSGSRRELPPAPAALTITVTGTGTNVLPTAVDDTGTTSARYSEPLDGTTVLMIADAEEGSVYEVTFEIERSAGKLDDIAERLWCYSKECYDARERRRIAYQGRPALSCPLGYRDVDPENAYGTRLCEKIAPPECSADFEPVANAADLEDGDIVVLKGDTPEAVGISPNGQYLATCIACAGPQYNVVVHAIDPNRLEAQWTVKRLANGKIALRSERGFYMARCPDCIIGYDLSNADLGLGNFIVLSLAGPWDPEAQFTIAAEGGGKHSLRADSGRYLSTCKDCIPLQDRSGFQYSVDVVDEDPNLPRSKWEIFRRRLKVVSLPADFIIAEDETINPTERWVVEPGEVLTIERGATLTVRGGAELVNKGTIIIDGMLFIGEGGQVDNAGTLVNQEILRLREGGVLDNQASGIVDNSFSNHIQNLNGSIVNAGVLFDPFDRYYGTAPDNPPVNGYYIGPNRTGQISCSLLGGSAASWNVDTDVCTVGNAWLRAGSSLTVAEGATLRIDGTLTNDGLIHNGGVIDNPGGLLRQCGGFGGSAPSTPGNVQEPCISSEEATQCQLYGGTWNPLTDDACLVESLGTVGVKEVLTIASGTTWEVSLSGVLENFGSIHIEEGGALRITGGAVRNGVAFELPDNTHALITNYGQIRIEADSSSGIPGQLENDFSIRNHGTMEGEGGFDAAVSVYAAGYVENVCGASYLLARNPPGVEFPNEIWDAPCPPPDFDEDGVNDEEDAFPYDFLETTDADGDGHGDALGDAFPLNSLEHSDTDGDCGVIETQTPTSGNGCGDSSDAFPEDDGETADSDLDETGDNADLFPFDPYETADSDLDDVGDNADAFPLNALEDSDSDGDCADIETQTETSGNGCGDASDPFPYDPDNTRGLSIEGEGWTTARAFFMDSNVVEEPPPTGADLSLGLLDLKLAGGAVGSTAVVTITYAEALAPDAVWWKYGRTESNRIPHWYVFGDAVIEGNTVTLQLTDGGSGDDDLVGNGRIVDPGGPGIPVPEPARSVLSLAALGVMGVLARRRVEARAIHTR